MTCCSNSVVTPGRLLLTALVFFCVALSSLGIAAASYQPQSDSAVTVAPHQPQFDSAVAAGPYQPQSDSVVLATLPATSRTATSRPQDLQSALTRAAADLELARTTGDPRFLGYAQSALQPWWNDQAAPLAVLLIRAQIHQRNHAFAQALADLGRALSLDARSAQARLTRAAIHQVQGDYGAAETECRSLALIAEPLTTADCMSRVRSHRGAARDAYAQLTSVRDRAQGIDRRQALEIDLTLGDIAARLGDAQRARGHYERALEGAGGDAYTLLMVADFLLDQREFDRVAEICARHPDHQDLLLRAALAGRALNAAGHAELARRIRDQYAAHRRRGDFAPSRDYARFLLDIENDATAALAAALENWESQREPADARILVRAAIAAGRPAAAAPVAAFVRQHKLEDAQLEELLTVLVQASRR